jgi:tripartite-type tricarboxylate transporter receptor subunit TctC
MILLTSVCQAQSVVITEGGADSFLLAKILFPDVQVVPKPGGDGTFALMELDKQKDSVYIGQTSTMVIPFLFNEKKIDTSLNYRLISAATKNSVVLITSSKSKYNTIEDIIKNKNGNIVLGGFGQNSVCFLIGKMIEKYYNINVLYIGYKTTNYADIDLHNGELDLECKGGPKIEESISTGLVKPILNLSRTHTNYNIPNAKFVSLPMVNYIFTSKNTSEEVVNKIMERIVVLKNDKNTIDTYKKENSEFIGLTEIEANKYFVEQKQSWFIIKKGIE